MDLSISTATAAAKTPEAESETPTRVKNLPFTNGVLKRHPPLHHQQSAFNHHPPAVVSYKECLKNHAASMGGHAVDGCGEFMPSWATNPADPTSLKCAACGCHRNFHRREPEEPFPPANAIAALEYLPHHRHHPPPPPPPPTNRDSSPNSPSPPPISSSYFPSAPHMLLSLSSGLSAPPSDNNIPISGGGNLPASTPRSNSNGRKRFRTKFTQDQKQKMLEFAEKLGWRMQKKDEDLISEFCGEISVDRGIFKVWMHNNKNIFCKRDHNSATNNGNGVVYSAFDTTSADGGDGGNTTAITTVNHYHHREDATDGKSITGGDMDRHHFHSTNGSSSSS